MWVTQQESPESPPSIPVTAHEQMDAKRLAGYLTQSEQSVNVLTVLFGPDTFETQPRTTLEELDAAYAPQCLAAAAVLT